MGCMSSSDPDHVEKHQYSADRYRRVSHVEGPEVNVAPIDVDEVHDVAVNDAIEKVSERAAEDQRQAKPRQAVVEAQLRAVGGNRQEGERSDYEHDHRLVRE